MYKTFIENSIKKYEKHFCNHRSELSPRFYYESGWAAL